MKIRIAQLYIGRNVEENRDKLLRVLQDTLPGEWVLFPEGALSGYNPDEADYLSDMDPEMIQDAIETLAVQVQKNRCHCVFGSATRMKKQWFNSVIILRPTGDRSIYHKIQLAGSDLHHFAPGSIPFFDTTGGVSYGTLACRELIFPNRWSELKKRGAQVVFHINNAIKAHDEFWKHLLISRAVENSIFVCSVNNANPPQALASYVIAPSGKILLKTKVKTEEVLTLDIDLNELRPDYDHLSPA
jgi:predicted amidohydrolase